MSHIQHLTFVVALCPPSDHFVEDLLIRASDDEVGCAVRSSLENQFTADGLGTLDGLRGGEIGGVVNKFRVPYFYSQGDMGAAFGYVWKYENNGTTAVALPAWASCLLRGNDEFHRYIVDVYLKVGTFAATACVA